MGPASGHAAIRTSQRLSVAAGSLVVAACAAGLLMWLGADPAVPRVSRLSIPSTATAAAVLTNTGRSHRTLTIAPDGSLIVYIGSNSTRLFARALNAVDPAELAAGQELRNPFVSPDGQWVGYTDGSALKKVALTGGTTIVLTNLNGTVLGATWLPDDTIVLATSATTGLQRVPAVGGPASELTRADHDHGQVAHIWPESLPGGNAVLFTIASRTNGQDSCPDRGTLISAAAPKGSSCRVVVTPNMSPAGISCTALLGPCGRCRSTCVGSRCEGRRSVSFLDW